MNNLTTSSFRTWSGISSIISSYNMRSFPCLWDSLTENKFRMTATLEILPMLMGQLGWTFDRMTSFYIRSWNEFRMTTPLYIYCHAEFISASLFIIFLKLKILTFVRMTVSWSCWTCFNISSFLFLTEHNLRSWNKFRMTASVIPDLIRNLLLSKTLIIINLPENHHVIVSPYKNIHHKFYLQVH